LTISGQFLHRYYPRRFGDSDNSVLVSASGVLILPVLFTAILNRGLVMAWDGVIIIVLKIRVAYSLLAVVITPMVKRIPFKTETVHAVHFSSSHIKSTLVVSKK
jgi:hypothetical protein